MNEIKVEKLLERITYLEKAVEQLANAKQIADQKIYELNMKVTEQNHFIRSLERRFE